MASNGGMLEPIQLDVVELNAPLSLRFDGKVVKYDDVVNQAARKKPDRYWSTQVDVKNLYYNVQVAAKQDIETVGNIFTVQKETKTVLGDINFSLLPSESTILLGRPRSGKTSLLDILGYRRKGNISGTVAVNGAERVENYHRLVSYVQQGDVHLPLLTVKETLTFSASNQLEDQSRTEQKVEEILQVLSLKHAQDTIVGDNMTRGISGGERRRVSIGVELAKECSYYMLDEPTTGLDSGAAYQIGQALRAISRQGTPVLAALLQPSWELVNQFDKLIILSEGEIGYWGPVGEALAYFDALGFSCPSHYSAAEFLAEVIDSPDHFPPDPEKPRLASRAELIAAYKKSDLFARMTAEATQSAEKLKASKHGPEQAYELSSVYEAVHASKYPRSRMEQFNLLLWRGMMNYIRDWKRECQNLLGALFVAIVIGLLFLRREDSLKGSGAKLALLFLLILRAAFEAIAGIAGFFIDRPVFYRQRAGHYYSVLPWVAASFAIGVPVMIVQSTFFPCIVYWMAGLRPDVGAFFFLCLQCMIIAFCFIGYVRFFGSLMPDPMLASILVAATAGVLILFSGFLIQKHRLPKAWRWLFWGSPFSYGFNAVAISEFEGTSLTCKAGELQPPTSIANFLLPYPLGYEGQQACPVADGSDYLRSVGLYADRHLQWAFFAGSVGWTVFYVILFYVSIRCIDFSDFRIVTGKNDVRHKLVVPEEKAKAKSSSMQGSILSWESLTYTVSVSGGQRDILKKVNGYVKPGMLLALMGASGAGKTTLLDVLAQRKNVGKISGRILMNGREPDTTYRRLIGYVEQTDMHFAQQTILEALHFAAECRLPSTVTAEERKSIVVRVLDLLDLRPIAGAMIGYGGQFGGINAEERKRLSMGVELVAQPSILFLDEPTSGLDSNAADVVMTAIQKVAQSGTSVICTIHQPSTRIFSRATHLLLLKKGGQVVYFGEIGNQHSALLTYLEKQGIKLQPSQNPADLVLAASLGKAGRSEADVLAAFEESTECCKLSEMLREIQEHPPEASAEYTELLRELRKPYATSFGRQFVLHLQRWLLNYWRDPYNVIMSIIRAVLFGLICGTSFYNRPKDPLGANERFAILFFSSLYADLTAFAYLPMVFFQRPIFYRERAERMYRTATYALGYVLADVPMIFAGVLAFTLAFYFFTGLERDAGHFFFYLLMSQLNTMVSIMFVQAICCIFSRPDTGGIIYASLSIILTTASGFLIPPKEIPDVIRWLNWVSFPRYFIESVSVSEFNGTKFGCPGNSAMEIPINATVSLPYCDVATRGPIDILNMDPDMMWAGVGALAAFYVFFAAVYILALQFINHVKR